MTTTFRISLHRILLLAIILFLRPHYAHSQTFPTESIDWSTYLSKRDITFSPMGKDWNSGVFTGNGWIGTMAYQGSSSNVLRIDIGRTDLFDHRSNGDHLSDGDKLFEKARLHIGNFNLTAVGTSVSGSSSKISPWNAENSGNITTDQGSINWKITTLSQKNIILLDVNTTGTENGFTLKFDPAVSQSPRNLVYPTQAPDGYTANPTATNDTVKNDVTFCWQPMLAGGGYATAWKAQKISTNHTIYYISIGFDTSSNNAAVDQAVNAVNTSIASDLNAQIAEHQNWWHTYYQKSFISVPDNTVQNFYWIQMYKLGSAMHAGGPALDLMGPWTVEKTPWPVYWNNLNTQLAYSPLFKSNHLDLASTLIKMIDDNVENLKNNVPAAYQYNSIGMARSCVRDMVSPLSVTSGTTSSVSGSAYELGDLTWLLHSYWQQYKYSMDGSLRPKFLSLLTKSINYYLNVMDKESDGYYHLPYTYSPEYATTRDCNYDLSLMRWGLMTLLKMDTTSSQRSQWQDALDNLVPYPMDGDVLRIGRDKAYTSSHRHYSHLLMIYPLQTMTYENLSNRPIIEASIAKWQSLTSALQGYSFTGSSSMYSMMGQGNKAYTQLMKFINGYAKPNTFYTETGPVIETPLACATSILDFLMQSRNDTIYAFHAMPDNWNDASFTNLLAEGAFKVSGLYKYGKTKWVHLTSQSGGICNVNIAKLNGKIVAAGDITTADLTYISDSVVSFSLPEGKEAWLYTDENNLTDNIETFSDPTDGYIDITDNGGAITGKYPKANSNKNEVVENLIDNKTSTKYFVAYPEVWIQYHSTVSAIVGRYSITSANDESCRDPKQWTLYGSNTASDDDWHALDSRSDVQYSSRQQTLTYVFENYTPYTYYKLDITSNNGATGTQLSEIALYAKSQESTTPVTLTGFKAVYKNKISEVQWTTLQEINTKLFEAERSVDGKNFSLINQVNAAGNKNSRTDYSINDRDISAGTTYYYRLKQIDQDGQYAYSNIISIQIPTGKTDGTIIVYPNPTTSKVHIKVSQSGRYELYTQNGIQLKQLSLRPGNDIFLDLATFPAGVYYISSESGKYKAKIVKAK